MTLIRIAILTVSDTGFSNPSADKSGPTIREIVSTSNAYEVKEKHCRIVQDDLGMIRDVVREWCESGSVDWLITTGGTGFGVRDVTPEAISSLIERPAPGIVHLMLSTSLRHTHMAALSRPVAGTFKNTLITTLPGSVKAVKENLEILLKDGLVEHAIDLVKGGSGQNVHSQLASGSQSHVHGSGGHYHHHHHHVPKPRFQQALSHDPSTVTVRHRQSPYPQVSLDDALRLIKQNVVRLPIVTRPVDKNLGGHVLAENIYASQNLPICPTTSVDGYALRSSDPPGIYSILTTESYSLSSPLPERSIFRINTGGALPAGADTVIMVEDTQLVSCFVNDSGTTEEKEVKTLVQVPPGDNVRASGSDVKAGDLVMSAGDRVTRGGGEVGTLTFVGCTEIKVYKKPVVALLSTGNEIVDLSNESVKNGAIGSSYTYDTNRPSLTAVLESMGYEVVDLGIVPDNIGSHKEALEKGLECADLILTTGGTSMGATDLLKPVIERYLDGIVHFGRVSVKPGKPTTFATVHNKNHDTQTPIFALPGNPASALVTFYVFVVPALRIMSGWPEGLHELPKVVVQIQNEMALDPRTEFHRVIIKSSINLNSSGYSMVLKAYSTGGQRSSRIASLSEANGLVILPVLGTTVPSTKIRLDRGEYVQAIVIGQLEMH